MKIEFTGRTALVTGGGVGLGRRIALDLAASGARVIATDILAEGLAETKSMAKPELGGALDTRILDLTSKDAITSAVAEIGQIDILVHSAGGVRSQVGRPIEEITLDDWHAIMNVNVTAAFLMAQAVTPGMKKAGGGRIVIISSGAGLGVSLTGIQAYASTKAAEIGLTRQLGHELGEFGITVNSVAPGFIRSNPASEKQWQSYGEEGQKQMIQRIARRRTGKPEDIANAVLFLASEQADWITGQTLSVDGGK